MKERLLGWMKYTFPSILIFLAADILLTIVFFQFTGQSVHIGTLRPESTIAPKILQLALVGLSVGLLASLASRKLDIGILTLAVAFTVFLDFDHLPSVFGMPQPIRPDHSVGFIALALTLLYVVNRKRPEIVLLAASAFMAHLAADTGIFAILAPFSFRYYTLSTFRLPLIVCSIALAILTGRVRYVRRSSAVRSDVMVEGVMNRK